MDNNSHGTHVAGILAGNGAIKGVAPDAKLVALKACDSAGYCYDEDIGKAIDWCIDNASSLNISVISMSLGGNIGYSSYCDNSFTPFINTAVGQNILVAVASGNNGWTNAISSPACVENATSVGAVYDANVGSRSWEFCTDSNTARDKIACFTNRGLNLDLLAPGVDINSSVLNGTYGQKSGTSMATPHVSGAALLLKEYSNELTPAQIETALKNSGASIYDSATGLTFPRIDVLNALNYLINESYAQMIKGIVSTQINATPFYTDINPRDSSSNACLGNLKAGESCEQTWRVTATGYSNTTYDFFTIYRSDYPTAEKETNRTSVTITAVTGGLIEYNISLEQGWNLISIPLVLENKSVNNVFNGVDYSHIFSYNSSWIIPANIDETMGLWVKMNSNDILAVEGIEPANTNIALKSGWNLIGYPSLEERNVTEVFALINASLDTVFMYDANDVGQEWKSYSPDKPPFLNTLTTMQPGYGYWVKVDEDVSMVIP